MKIVSMVFFVILGIAGLIYKVDVGVFIGFFLFPFQFSKMKKGQKANYIVIGISAIIGSIYFIWIQNWLVLALFLVSQGMVYASSQQLLKAEKEKEENEGKK